MQIGGRFVAEGTYGCVFNPPISCVNEIESKYKGNKYVGKVLFNYEDFKEELDASKLIKKVDPSGKFSIIPVAACKTNPMQFKSSDQISMCERHNNLYINDQIVYPDGGIALSDIKKGSLYIDDVYNMSIDLFKGIHTMISAGVVHCDIKPDNIVYHAGKGKMFFIDFGLITTPSKLLRQNFIVDFPYQFYPYHFKSIQLHNSNKGKANIENAFEQNIYTHLANAYIRTHIKPSALRYKSKKEFIEDVKGFEEHLLLLPNARSIRKYFIEKVLSQTDIFSLVVTLFELAKKFQMKNEKVCNAFENILISLRQLNVEKRPRILDAIREMELLFPKKCENLLLTDVIKRIAERDIPKKGTKKVLCEKLHTYDNGTPDERCNVTKRSTVLQQLKVKNKLYQAKHQSIPKSVSLSSLCKILTSTK
jgi:serine/threonine protein kinase